MANYKIAIVVGSLRKESFNLKLAKAVAGFLPDNFQYEFLDISKLPLFNQDKEQEPNEEVARFKQAIKAADGVFFFTAEYNRSIPGVLKNAIDVGSRPYGDNAWADKPAVMGGISIGAMGTCMAQQHLRCVLAFLNMPTMNQPELYLQNREGMFDEKGNIGIENSRQFIKGWTDNAAQWIVCQVNKAKK